MSQKLLVVLNTNLSEEVSEVVDSILLDGGELVSLDLSVDLGEFQIVVHVLTLCTNLSLAIAGARGGAGGARAGGRRGGGALFVGLSLDL